jgi:hypothetical protein
MLPAWELQLQIIPVAAADQTSTRVMGSPGRYLRTSERVRLMKDCSAGNATGAAGRAVQTN